MKRFAVRLAFVLLACSPLSISRGGTVRGTVKNGTTGQAAAGVELALLQPMNGMQEVAHSRSGAQGEFTFDHPGLGAQPMLVQANYQGIHFNQMVPPGTSSVQVQVFEPSKESNTISVPAHVVVFQPNGATMIVGEEYQVENKSQPPHAYYRKDGSFDFVLPEEGRLRQVAAAGPAGMPLPQLAVDKKKNRYSIAYAFQPGESSVRYSYELPYTGNTATVKIPTVYPGGKLLVVAPPTVQVIGDGLVPGGQEQGMSLYGREDVPAGTLVSVSLSGTAPAASANGGGEQAQQGRDAQQSGGDAGVNIQAVPGRLDALKWPMIFGMVAIFALGGYLLNRKQVVVPVGTELQGNPPQVPKKAQRTAKAAVMPHVAPPMASQSTPPTPSNGQATLKEVDAAIGTSLDELKESLFRLELRHQAGTISEEEYSRERARAEKVLRDLVRG